MQAVFHLKTGEVGVAMNHPETIAYVVRVVSHGRTLSQLHNNFLLTSTPSVSQVSQINSQNIFLSLIRDLETASNLHWNYPPDEPRNVQ